MCQLLSLALWPRSQSNHQIIWDGQHNNSSINNKWWADNFYPTQDCRHTKIYISFQIQRSFSRNTVRKSISYMIYQMKTNWQCITLPNLYSHEPWVNVRPGRRRSINMEVGSLRLETAGLGMATIHSELHEGGWDQEREASGSRDDP